MPRIDTERFLRDLNELRKISAYKTGVHRPTYSPEDMESRHWLMDRLRECGLDASIDGIGTGTTSHPVSTASTIHMTRIPSLCRIGLWATKEYFRISRT